MPNLREIANQDLQSVLMDLDECGEQHTIDGRSLVVVEDSDALRERNDQARACGMHLGSILYFAKATDFPRKPETDQVQIYDGRTMYVVTANEDMGMLEVTLSQNRMGAIR